MDLATIGERLMTVANRGADVVDLRSAPPLLCRQVVAEGELLLARDPILRFDFEHEAVRRWEDTRPLRPSNNSCCGNGWPMVVRSEALRERIAGLRATCVRLADIGLRPGSDPATAPAPTIFQPTAHPLGCPTGWRPVRGSFAPAPRVSSPAA